MKIQFLLVAFLSILLAGCASGAGNSNTPSPTEDPQLIPLKKYAADKLNLKQSDIVFVRMSAEEWPDACLGLPEKDEMCAMVITPGYLIIFNSPQGTLEFHTGRDLSYFRMAPVGSTSTLLTWQRSGGIAGICQQLEILSDNSFTITNCANSILAQGVLPDTEATELTNYIQQFNVTDWFSTQQPGSADMFNDHYILYGKGEQKASDSQMVQINEWIADLVGKLSALGGQSSFAEDSGIEGLVTIGPTCPGPVRIGDTECADKPYQAWISILDAAGKAVARVQSDINGHYRVSLTPGKYNLMPESPGAMPFAQTQAVEILAGKYISVNIQYDSGMR